MHHETDSEFVGHEPCPECNSSDALARYDDGHGFCFGCQYYQHSSDDSSDRLPTGVVSVSGRQADDVFRGMPQELQRRRISKKTCTKWHYLVGKDYNGKPVQIANYYDEEGNFKCQKVRWADKSFTMKGDKKNPPLYGMHLWQRGGKKIVVTEGEIDALSVSEAQENKWPVVSLPNGASSAKKAIKQHLEYLESFDEVILMFDNDEAGNKAVEESVNLFSPSKVKVAKLEAKDPNELLQAGRVREIIDAVWRARPYQPDGVICAADLKEAIEKPVEYGLSYPWKSVTDQTYGIRLREIITLGAGTGMGKSEWYKEIATHLLMHHKENVGMLYLEEAPKDTLLGIMGKYASIPFHIPDSTFTEEQRDEAFEAVTKDNRLFLYDSFGYTDYEVIKSRIRFLVVSCGCKYIFLDHVTALVSSSDVQDERRALDNIMTSLASMVRELNFTLFLVSHLSSPEGKPHEEGGRVQIKQFRGSRAIGQWSSYMIGLERNQQASDEEVRGTTIMRILKDRYTGRASGFTQAFGYDNKTGRLFEKQDCPFDTVEEF